MTDHRPLVSIVCPAYREEEVLVCIVPQDGVEKTEALAHELFKWCVDRLAYFKAPGWLIYRDSLPLTTSQRLHKIQIFPKGSDPRKEPGIYDLRALKKAPGKAAAHAHPAAESHLKSN